MINVNDIPGRNDSDRINEAIAKRSSDGIVVIPPRAPDNESDRTFWLLDSAILLPENTTVILQNCTIKLSDRCRDNFFRTANCGLGIADPARIRNVHLKGEGRCTLIGADHPRATGDGSKDLACPCPKTAEDLIAFAPWVPEEHKKSGKLDFFDVHQHSYGTDAGKEGESQYGDWRGIGILFANVENFTISGIHMIDSHGWNVSCEACAFGRIENMSFDACMAKEIDGLLCNMENQDGIDLRNGCHDILIDHVTGVTGDDLVALTAIATDDYYPGGSLQHTQVMHADWSRRERDIHDITVRNIVGYSKGGQAILRLLPVGSRIYNVVVDGIIDTSPEGVYPWCAAVLGEPDMAYGKNGTDGMKDIIINNVVSDNGKAIVVNSYISDSIISNVINRNPNCAAVTVTRKDSMTNVLLSSIVTSGGPVLEETF